MGIRGEQVLLRVRTDGAGGSRVVAITGVEFIGRFLQHVLPTGFKRIRHYGLLAPRAKTQRLAAARELLHMPQPQAQRQEDARAFMRRVAALDITTCAHCRQGRWMVVQTCPADPSRLAQIARPMAPSASAHANNRAPP